MEYHIRLDSFEGPLDLLLHLINKAKINIEDVSITEITQQYLDYLNKMKEFDVDIASDFLVMAATLLHIKSRSLLPKHNSVDEDDPDLEQELIRRLAEYKIYKEASQDLKRRKEAYGNIYYKLPEEIVNIEEKALAPMVGGIGEDLLAIFTRLVLENNLKKVKARVHPISREPISILQRQQEIKDLFKENYQLSFFELFHNVYNSEDIVLTFLALLEMLKANQVLLFQDKQFEDITIRRAR